MPTLTVTTATDEAFEGDEILNGAADGTTVAGNDTTDLSLREAIGLASAGDTIIFDGTLDGATITLNGAELEITKGLIIDGDMDANGGPDITVDANQQSRVFNISGETGSTLDGLTITGGSVAGSGGGINSASALTVRNSVITGNQTSSLNGEGGSGGYGGGIATTRSLDITNSTISNNTTTGDGGIGGGILARGGATLTNSTVSGNSTSGNNAKGGGLYTNGSLTLSNSTVSGNSTSGDYAHGGGIYTSFPSYLTNSTISGNSTVGNNASGGGIYSNAPITLTNSIILGNDSAQTQANEVAGSLTYTGVNIVGAGTDTDASDGVINADPAAVFANTAVNGSATAGVLADNGGTVQTIALRADAANPALDVGPAQEGIHTDATGNSRNTDLVSVGNDSPANTNTVDAGAVELQGETPSLLVTTASDVVDALDGQTSLREAISFANSTPNADTITFDNALNGSTITLGGTELTITNGVIIDGDLDDNGTPDITIDANQQSRVFNISGETGSTLDGLTITGGSVAGSGGGINSTSDLTVINSTITGHQTTGSLAYGGGIYSQAALTISNSTISGNTTAGYLSRGAGFFSQGTVTLTNSAVEGNSTLGNKAFGGGFMAAGKATLVNTTVSGNTTAGSQSYGGGFWADTPSLFNSTVSGNSTTGADGHGGGILSIAPVELTNSIILGNDSAQSSHNEIIGSLTANGLNIVGTGSDTDASDGVINADPAAVFANTAANGSATAGVLADNGGTVQTIALRADAANPALDVGPAQEGIHTDATGNSRNTDLAGVGNDGPGNTSTVDAGAVEVQSLGDQAPTITAVAQGVLGFTEGDGPLTVFNITDIDTKENGQSITALEIELINIHDGIDEILNIDGTAITLTAGTQGTTTGNSLSYSVTQGVGGSASFILALTDMTIVPDTLKTILNAVTYENLSDNPTVRFQAHGASLSIASITDSGSDSGANSNKNTDPSVASYLAVLAVDDDPTVTMDDTTLVYTVGDQPIQIDATATAFDPEGNWDGGRILAHMSGNPENFDSIYLVQSPTLSIEDADVKIGGTIVGQIGAISSSEIGLQITLNSQATGAHVNEILQSFYYSAQEGANTASDKTVQFTVYDGDGPNAPPTSFDERTINVQDKPVVVTPTPTPTPEPEPATPSSGGATPQEGTIKGSGGQDNLEGTSGDDIIVGGDYGDNVNTANPSGDDRLVGGDGNDILVGGHYDATKKIAVNTGVGKNQMWGGKGNDQAYGDDDVDVIGGGEGNDTILAGGGDDIVYGGIGDAAENNDVIDGGDGNDKVYASKGKDDVKGGLGDDLLYGGSENDTVDGGAGNDDIYGGTGDDQLTGGAGSDTFHFRGGFGKDTIGDFGTEQGNKDTLDLSGIDGLTLEGINTATSFDGGNALIDLGDQGQLALTGIGEALFQTLLNNDQILFG